MSYKLVRDNHQEVMQGRISGTWRTSPDPAGSLVRKLGEEYGEFAKDRDPGELYDLLDVIGELAVLLDPFGEAQEYHEAKTALMGLFGNHLEWHPELLPRFEGDAVNEEDRGVRAQEEVRFGVRG
jgi:predicted house-cleaning noncanonical NTP pyrophosphatase (MazG superfamily)